MLRVNGEGVDWMPEAMQNVKAEKVDTQHGEFLTFLLGEETFGIEIRYVTEIIGIQRINNLPEAPEYVKEIINLRGKIIPVIDMRVRFKKEAAEYTDRTSIIVIDVLGTAVGLVVDCVLEVSAILTIQLCRRRVFTRDFRTNI